jgi:tocopherol O-methyltransferase
MADPRMIVWYEEKTKFLLAKYAVSNRVHYHTGLVDPSIEPAVDLDALRLQIWRSQEDMLHHAARAWNADSHLRGEILDVGCGFGGGPLYWAERYGARVTGLTPVADHLPIIARCIEQAGLGGRVTTLLGDAHTAPSEGAFDAVVATGASNYFDRPRWFAHLDRLLRPHGRVFIEDTFAGRDEVIAPFNAYWISNLGRLGDYCTAAARAGFELIDCQDVTLQAAGFWRLSVAYSERLLALGNLDEPAVAERRRSISWQRRVYEYYLDGGFQNLLLHFCRKRG